MSTILVDNLTGKTSAGSITVTSGSVTMEMQEVLAKHYLYFDMASTTAINSFNNSSLTDVNVGRFTTSVTNSFSNTDYLVQISSNAYAADDFPSAPSVHAKIGYNLTVTTSLYDISSYNGNSGFADAKYNYLVGHGDLA